MKVVIPLAGKGTRLRPHTHVTPKPLLRVGDKPGIWFFSLDAASPLAVAAARLTYRLPYRNAHMRMRRADGQGVWLLVATNLASSEKYCGSERMAA